MTSKPSVDALWAQLKVSAVPSAHGTSTRPKADLDALWFSFNNDVIKKPTKTAVIAARTPPTALPIVEVHAGQVHPATENGSFNNVPTAPTVEEPLEDDTYSEQELEEVEHTLQRLVAALKDASAAVRRRAVADIKAATLDAKPPPPPTALSDWVGSMLGKALLRRFDDGSEAVREAAVTLLAALLQVAPEAVLAILPYAMPVLEERLQPSGNGKRLAEGSEEVRLGLARLLTLLISLSEKAIDAYAGEAAELIKACLADPYYEVNSEGCAALKAFDAALGMRLQPIAKELVAAVLPLATHRRHRVRIDALQALQPLMHEGAHEMILEMVAFRDPNVIAVAAFYGDDLKINFCGKLATDPHPQVRLQFVRLLGNWMLHLRERMDHEHRLLPYVLSALDDESPAVVLEAVALLEALGEEYEKEHAKELKETLVYLPAEAHGLGWQPADAQRQASGYVYGAQALLPLSLPVPFPARPRLGTRRLVQTNFGRTAAPLAAELSAWQGEPRRRAALLLRENLTLLEDAAAQHLGVLLPALCKAICEPDLSRASADCAALLGCFVDPSLSLALLAPRVADDGAEPTQRIGAISVLKHVVRGAGARGAMDPHLPEILTLLEADTLLLSNDSSLRMTVSGLLQAVIASCTTQTAADLSARLLWLCLHLDVAVTACEAGKSSNSQPFNFSAASSAGAATTAAAGTEPLLAQLAAVVACNSSSGATAHTVPAYDAVDQLLARHRSELFTRITLDTSSNGQLQALVLARLLLLPSPDGNSDGVAGSVGHSALYGSSSGSRGSSSAGLLRLLLAPDELTIRVQPWDAAPDVGLEVGRSEFGPSTSAEPSAQHAPTAIFQHLGEQLPWLSRRPRSAAAVLLCLESYLLRLPRSDRLQALPSATAAAPANSRGRTSAASVAAPVAKVCETADSRTLQQLLWQQLLQPALQLLQPQGGVQLLLTLRCTQAGLFPAPPSSQHIAQLREHAGVDSQGHSLPELQAQLLRLLLPCLSADSVPTRLQALNVLAAVADCWLGGPQHMLQPLQPDTDAGDACTFATAAGVHADAPTAGAARMSKLGQAEVCFPPVLVALLACLDDASDAVRESTLSLLQRCADAAGAAGGCAAAAAAKSADRHPPSALPFSAVAAAAAPAPAAAGGSAISGAVMRLVLQRLKQLQDVVPGTAVFVLHTRLMATAEALWPHD